MSSEKPVTALDWILLKDKNLALSPIQGPEISSWACLWVSPRPHHQTQCWLINQWLILLRYVPAGDSQSWLRSKKPQKRAAPCELIGDLITLYSSMFRTWGDWVLLIGILRELKEGSGNGTSLSVGALWGEPEGGLLHWKSGRICGRGLRGWVSLSMRALLGSLEGGLFTGDLRVEEGSRAGHLSPQRPQ